MARTHSLPWIALLLVLVLTTAAAFPQAEKVDDFVKAEMRARRMPGVSIAVVRNGEVVSAKGYGLAFLRGRTTASCLFL